MPTHRDHELPEIPTVTTTRRPRLTPEQERAEWDALYDYALARADYFREQRLSGADPSLQYRI